MRIFGILGAILAAATLTAADAPVGKTWVLSVGISKYQKLPNDLWLQYPDIDAITFAKFLASPQGGAVPAAQMMVLTNGQGARSRPDRPGV